MMALSKKRAKMRIGEYPRHILLRVQPVVFHRLHLRAAENGRSLNFEINEVLRVALSTEKAALA